MARTSPLRKTLTEAEASFLPWGPADSGIEVVETFGEVHAEYAALRKGCVLLDQPHRGVVEVGGADRIDFLNRMITQELKGVGPFRAVRSFWLNRKGRIDADLRVIVLEDRIVFDLDALSADNAVRTLDAFVIADDVTLRDLTDRRHRLALHGPTSLALLREVATHKAGAPLPDLQDGQVAIVEIAGKEVLVDRQDATGEIGLELHLAPDDVEAVWNQLIETGADRNGDEHENGAHDRRHRLRPAGWHAFNIARIESGWPLYNIDFGPQSLPAETGVLRDRVHFKKGCYLGQEVVARMDALGKPKQVLVAMRLNDTGADSGRDAREANLPVAGAQVFALSGESAEVVGAVTSSTISPMLGGAAVCFAQVRTKHADPGARLTVAATGSRVEGEIQPSLRFWPKERAQ